MDENRRSFVKKAGVVAAGSLLPWTARVKGANDRGRMTPSTSAASFPDRGSRRKGRGTAPMCWRGLRWKSSPWRSFAPWT